MTALRDDDAYLKNWDLMAELIARGYSMSARERNCCFLNTRAVQFADVSELTGLNLPEDSRGISLVDWDHDGDLDIWMTNRTGPRVRFFRNNVPTDNQFVQFRLHGVQCNRDAIGARVELKLSGVDQPLIRTVRAGDGFVSQSSKWLHFGVPRERSLESVTIRWPGSADPQSIGDLRPNRRYRIVQGSPQAHAVAPVHQTPLALRPSKLTAPPATQKSRAVLTRRKPLPPRDFASEIGDMRPLPTGKRYLLNLWASWCQPCLQELADFAGRYDELQQVGIDVLALSTDDCGPQRTGAAARQFATNAQWPFPWGFATAELLGGLTELDNGTFYFQTDLPAPTNFLIDEKGSIAVIYRGPVSVDQLIQDARLLDLDKDELMAAAMPLPGRNGLNFFAIHPIAFAESYLEGGYYDDVRSVIGQWLQQTKPLDSNREFSPAEQKLLGRALSVWGRAEQRNGNLSQAARLFQRLLKLNSASPDVHFRLADLYGKMGREGAAVAQLEQMSELANLTRQQRVQLGMLLLQRNQASKAIDVLRDATQADPDNLATKTNLAVAYEANRDFWRAIELYKEVLERDPQHSVAANNLAWILATNPDDRLRDPELALELAKRASKSARDLEPAFLDTVAAALAENGQFENAQHIAHAAADLFEQRSAHESADRLRQRAALYARGEPYRE